MILHISDEDLDVLIEALRLAAKSDETFAGTLSRVELEAQGARMIATNEEDSGGPILRWQGSQQAHAEFMALQKRAGRH
jgi:hypothetical protein